MAAPEALRLGRACFEPSQLVVMGMAAGLDGVHEMVAEGADIVSVPDAALAGAVRAAYPALVIGVRAGSAEVAREACAAGADLVEGGWLEVAAESGVGVVCTESRAAAAVAAGVGADRVIVEADGVLGSLGPIGPLGPVGSWGPVGWPVLVSLAGEELAGDLARAAVYGWLGARVFRVRRVGAARRALRMVSAIRGDMPPAFAVRGLA
jgi:dihydropteroate synthase